MQPRTRVAALLVLMEVASTPLIHCWAQEEISFSWSFSSSDNAGPPNLISCENVGIVLTKRGGVVDGTSSIGTPPYYALVYGLDGMVTLSELGSDAENLTWLVNHPSGSEIVFGVVDSEGHSGGVSSAAYTVQAGLSSSCLPSRGAMLPTVTTNVTRDLETCQALGLSMSGGTAPYTVFITYTGASVIETLGQDENIYTYINTAPPDSQLLISVSDANGVWAKSPLKINTIGPSMSSCDDPLSTSRKRDSIPGTSLGIRDATTSTSQPGPPPSKQRIAVIVGVCLGVSAVILIVCFAFFIYFMRRRGRWRWGCEETHEVALRSWASTSGDTTCVSNTLVSPLSSKRSRDGLRSKSRVCKSPNPVSTLGTVDFDLDLEQDFYRPPKALSPGGDTTDETQTQSTPSSHHSNSHPPLRLDMDVLDISPANNPPSPTPSPAGINNAAEGDRSHSALGGDALLPPAFPQSSSRSSTPVKPLPVPPTLRHPGDGTRAQSSPLSPTSRPFPATPMSPLSPRSRRRNDIPTPSPSSPRRLQLHTYISDHQLRSYRSTPNVRPLYTQAASTAVSSPYISEGQHSQYPSSSTLARNHTHLNTHTHPYQDPHSHPNLRHTQSQLHSRHIHRTRGGGPTRVVGRSRSLGAMRSLAYGQGQEEASDMRETWTEDRQGRSIMILQHRDAHAMRSEQRELSREATRTFVQELPPPYHEIEHVHGRVH